MKHDKVEGSVTVFLSLILLLIIALTCTIIDGTRIQIAKLQAMRALRQATHSALASYDSGIAREYGVFAKEEQEALTEEITSYALAALRPEEHLPKVNIIHQVTHPKPPLKPFRLFDYQLDVIGVKPTGKLVEGNTDYMKLQILEYMKYRGPILMIEPFLEKLQVISKSSKTAAFVQKKIELEEQVASIDTYYNELERYIDGLNISRKGEIRYEDFFVKQLVIHKESYSEFLDTIPKGDVRAKLQKKSVPIYSTISLLNTYFHGYDTHREKMVSSYRALYEKRKAMDHKESKISQKDSEINQVRIQIQELQHKDSTVLEEAAINHEQSALEAKEASLREEKSSLKESLRRLQKEEKTLRKAFHDEAVAMGNMESHIQILVSTLDSLRLYEESNEKALDVILGIQRESQAIESELKALENDLGKNKDAIIETTGATLEGQLQALRGRLALPNGQHKKYNLVQNVVAIKEELTRNLEQLRLVAPKAKTLREAYQQGFAYYRVYELIDPESEVALLNALIGEKNPDEDKPYFSYGGQYKTALSSYQGDGFITKNLLYLDEVKAILVDYSYDNMVFDYGDMEQLTEAEIEAKDPRQEVQVMASQEVIPEDNHDASPLVSKETLPSHNHPTEEPISLVATEEVDFMDHKRGLMGMAMGTFSDLTKTLGELTWDLRDQLYINEYILGQFASRMDHLSNQEALTLSGYDKKEHLLHQEVEYVLRGSLQEDTNVKYVANTILGIRFVMNYIHLLTNTEKRTMLMSIATAIAGWWSFGLGTYIVCGLMMAAWSYAESMVDLRYLLEGKQVPFMKTRATWYTSYNGIINGVFEEATDMAISQSGKLLDSLSDGVKQQASHMTKRLNEEAGRVLEEQIEGIVNQAKGAVAYGLDDVDAMVDQVIQDAFNHIREGIGEKPSAKDYLQVEAGHIGKHLLDTIYRDYAHQITEASYGELMTLKKELIDHVNGLVEKVKEKVVMSATTTIEGVTDRLEERINRYVNQTGTKYKEIATEKIQSFAQDIQARMKGQLDGKLNESLGNSQKKYMSLVPNLSYRDYLRLLLLVGVKEDTKLYRVIDLIQMNKTHKAGGQSMTLQKHATGLEVTADVSINYVFFGLPFMPESIRSKIKGRYTFTINTAMTY